MNLLNIKEYGYIISRDDLDYMQDNTEDQLRKRLLIAATSGIVQTFKPNRYDGAFSVISDTSGLEINGGTVVFPSSDIYTFTKTIIPYPTLYKDHYLVASVYTEYFDEAINRDRKLIRKKSRLADKIYFSPVDSYTANINHILLYRLNFNDNTQSWVLNLTENCLPWFSREDHFHRAQTGTGYQSTTNPHAMSFNDLTLIDDLHFWDLLIGDGIVTAKRENKISGALTTEVVPFNEVAIDSGMSTVKTTNSIHVLISVEVDGEEVAANVVSPYSVKFASKAGDVTLKYTTVYLGQLEMTSGSKVIFDVYAPGHKEIAVLRGKTVKPELQTFNIHQALRYAMTYDLLLTDTGYKLNPEQILIPAKLSMLQNPLDMNLKLDSPSTLYIGLTDGDKTTPTPNAMALVRIVGEDETGTAITEDLLFTDAWRYSRDITGYNPDQFVVSTKLYTRLKSVSVLSSLGLSLESCISIFAKGSVDSLYLYTIKTKADYGIASISDNRRVYSLFQRQELPYFIGEKLHENFTNPVFSSLDSDWDSSNALLINGIYKSRKIVFQCTVGDKFYLILRDGKYQGAKVTIIDSTGYEWNLVHTELTTSSLFVNNSRIIAYDLPNELIQKVQTGNGAYIVITATGENTILGYAVGK